MDFRIPVSLARRSCVGCYRHPSQLEQARGRAGLNFRLTYNSARSGFRPDLNPNDASQLGNTYLINTGAFNSSLFAAALGNVNTISTQISEVIVPQWIGQSKAYYIFPRKFEGGLFYYGSYRDYWNPNLNGTLRTFNVWRDSLR